MLRTLTVCFLASMLATVAVGADALDSERLPFQPRLLAQNQAKPKAEVKAAPAPLDAATETAVLAFVREHHAELANLLENLKESRPKEYQKAVRDLTRVRERLAQFKKTNPDRYDLEIAMWKAESRTQLLAARLHMSDSAELREQLRASLHDQYERKLAILKFERDMLEERLTKTNDQLQKMETERSQAIERQLQVLLKAPAAKNVNKTVSKPAKTDKKAAEAATNTKPAKSSSPTSSKQP